MGGTWNLPFGGIDSRNPAGALRAARQSFVDMIVDRAGVRRMGLRVKSTRAACGFGWGTNVLYRDLVPMKRGVKPQKGWTITKMTMKTIRTAGISFQIR